jgi:hypothetical protein
LNFGTFSKTSLKISREARSLPFFWERFTPGDALSAACQMRGRKSGAARVLGTAARCRFGFPRVIVCAPLQGVNAPFPTSFWLTCPWLTRAAGELESSGGVRDLERWIEFHAPREWVPFNILHQRLRLALLPEPTLRFLRRFRPQILKSLRGGVGGVRFDAARPREEKRIHVKCLHLQTASWLALHRHPGALWLAGHGAGLDCCGEMIPACRQDRGPRL